MEQDHKREWAGSSGSGEIGFGIWAGSRKDKTGGDTGGSVAERFYGYCLGGVTRNEVENTKNGDNESPKYRHVRVRSRTAKKNVARRRPSALWDESDCSSCAYSTHWGTFCILVSWKRPTGFLCFILVYSLGYLTLRLSQITPTLLEPSASGPVPNLCGELISVIRAMVRPAL